MQILRPVFLLTFLVRAALGLYQHSVRDAPKSKLRPSASLLRTSQLSRKTSLRSAVQRTGANVTLDSTGDKLQGVLDEVTKRMSEVQVGFESVHDVCVDLMTRAELRINYQKQEMDQFQKVREMKLQEKAMQNAKLDHLVKLEGNAKASYDSSVAQRAMDIDKYLASNKSLVEQKVVFAKVLDLLNEKRALATAPKNYSENFSYVPTSVASASSMDYVMGVIQNLQKTAATKSTEQDSKFATSDKELATLVSSFKESLQHLDEQYDVENLRRLEADSAVKTAGEEKAYRSLFISGEEGINSVWKLVCGNEGVSSSISGCWVSPDASAAPSDKPFVLWTSGDNIFAESSGYKGSGKYKDGKVSFEWKGFPKPLADVSINDIWWTRVSTQDCGTKLKLQGDVGESITAVNTSMAEVNLIINKALSSMDNLPVVQTDLLQTHAVGARRRPQSGAAETAADRRDELLRLARDVQTRRAHPAATSTAPSLEAKQLRPAKPLLRVVATPQPVVQPSLEVTTADLALRLLLGANQHAADMRGATASGVANSSQNTDSMNQVVADCMNQKQAETDKIITARQALRAAHTNNHSSALQYSTLNTLYTAIAEQKKMFTDHQNVMTQAYTPLSAIENTKSFTNAMATAIQEMDTIKAEVNAYINAGGPPAASGVLTSIDTIKTRLNAMKTKTESDISSLLSIQGDKLLLKYTALIDQVDEKALDLIKVMEEDEAVIESAGKEITKQEAALQAALVARETVEYKCQSPGTCGILHYQQCCADSEEKKYGKLVSTWAECAQHCEAVLAAGNAVVGCEMASDDKSSPGYCDAMTKCTLTTQSRHCAGSRCKPAHLAIGET